MKSTIEKITNEELKEVNSAYPLIDAFSRDVAHIDPTRLLV